MKNEIKAISYDLVPSIKNNFEEVMVTYTFNGKTYHYSIFIELKKDFTQKDYLNEAKKVFNNDIESGKVLKSTKSIKAKGPKKPFYIALTATLGAVAVTMSGLFIWKMVGSGDKTEWEPMVGDINKPLTFVCNEDNGSIDFNYYARQDHDDFILPREIKLYYQVNNGSWNKVEGIHQIPQDKTGDPYEYTVPIIHNVKKGQEIHLACDGEGYWSNLENSDAYETLSIFPNGNFTVANNIMSLKNKDNFVNLNSVIDGEFKRIFSKKDAFSSGITDASGLLLPAKKLSNQCYQTMFLNNNKLTYAPTRLPAMRLERFCYAEMFSGCSSLITAPELPSGSLAKDCYFNMFSGCSSLTVAPELPADLIPGDSCYEGMFSGCSSLTAAPELYATFLMEDCYRKMFYDCLNLKYIKVHFGTTDSWDWPVSVEGGEPFSTNWLTNAGKSVQGEKVFIWNGSDEDEPDGWRSNDTVPEGWTIKHADA